MKTQCKVIRYDLYGGIAQAWWQFLPAVIWGIYIATRVEAGMLAGQAMGLVPADAAFTFADVCLYTFRGMAVYIPSPSQPFEIPVEWLIWFVYLALITSQYTYGNLCGVGQQFLIRFKKRRYWWWGKCVWSACTTVLAYLILLAVLFVYTLLRGRLAADASLWMSRMIGYPLLPDTAAIGWQTLWLHLTVCALVSTALAQLQTALVLFIKPIGAFLTVLVFVAAGAYIQTPLLFSNYAMWIRSEHFALDNGLEPLTGILIAAACLLIAIVAGGVRFSRYDVINIQD